MESRIAVVTGGNRGLGLACTQALAELGYVTIIGARDAASGAAEAERLREQHSLRVRSAPLDISDTDSVDAFFDGVVGKYGRIDVLVNNAGVFLEGNAGFTEIDEATLMQSLAVNTMGAWRSCKAVAPQLKRQRYGRIVNVTTGWASLADMEANAAAYRISKAALNALTRIVAADLASAGDIKVNAVCPGWVRTRMGGPDAEISPEEAASHVVWAATLDENGPTGGFFRHRLPLQW